LLPDFSQANWKNPSFFLAPKMLVRRVEAQTGTSSLRDAVRLAGRQAADDQPCSTTSLLEDRDVLFVIHARLSD
jgi:hypothetical protein